MPFKAKLSNGVVRHIRDCSRADAPFACQNGCGPMSYVQGEVRRTAHFRHHVACTCNWEPETDDHESAKEAVCVAINQMGRGTADVEVMAGKFTADVLWTYNGQRIAFEVQRANYPWVKFREKIEGYAADGIATVYLFIGPEFYRGGARRELRLKEVEHSLSVGAVELCEPRHRYSSELHLPEIVRLRRRLPPRTTAAYLRRKAGSREALLVREPMFYPALKKDLFPKQSHVWEMGAAVSSLAVYLAAVGNAFFAPKEAPFLWGCRFATMADAQWAYLFGRLGLEWDYNSDADNEPGMFTLRSPHGGKAVLASLGGGPGSDNDGRSAPFLQLNDAPALEQDLCKVGELQHSGSNDIAVLASYRGAGTPIVDFSQLRNDYSGAITGRHDGGAPGGADGKELATEAIELWRDGAALIEIGHSYPLLFPTFEWPVRPCPIFWPLPTTTILPR